MTQTTSTTSLFKPAEITSAYLKQGIFGFAGSGKTKTATIIAIGLIQEMRKRGIEDKPVFFLDTETGSDWVKPDFDRAGIDLYVAKTRAFADLLLAVPEAEAHGSLLLVDSVSHFWKELCDSYQRRRMQQLKATTYRLQFQDWGYLKGEWGKFTDLFINSRLHMILCGRAGYEYDYFEDDDGKKQLEKTGIKMKAEGEMGYEPSLLLHMERHQKIEGGGVAESWRTATVLKDRSTMLDGKEFRNPTFDNFLPHIALLNLGGRHLGVDTSRTSEHLVPDGAPKDRTSTQRAIVVDEIADLLLRHDASGTSVAAQKKRSDLMQRHFGTVSKTKIEDSMSIFDLRAGYNSLHQDLEGGPSHYLQEAPAAAAAEPINDALPNHSAKPAERGPLHDRGYRHVAERVLAELEVAKPPAERGPLAREVAAQHMPWYDRGYRGEPRGGNEAEQAAWDRGANDRMQANHSAKPAETKCTPSMDHDDFGIRHSATKPADNASTLLKVAELAAPKVEDGAPGGIPDFLRRPVPPKDRLLGEIAGLRTPDAALDWCLRVSASEDYEGLPKADKLAVHAALNLRQAKLRNGHAAA